MKRRTFIKTASAGMFAGMIMPRQLIAAAAPVNNNIGLQLYSLRNEIKEDLAGSLEKIAKIGYKQLEAAGYSDGKFYGLEPQEFNTLVENLGMKVVSSHLTFKGDEVTQVLNAHKEAGIKNLVWPSLNKDQRASLDSYREVADHFNTIGEFCTKNNLRFGYHNHDFEFYPVEGQKPYDLLLEMTDPSLVFMQLDLYWIIYAGEDPVKYFEKYPGRFRQWHVKDMKAGEERAMTEVGTGIIDFKSLFEYATKAGMKELFIEQDEISGDGFDSVKMSFDNLSNILL
jgi:sugar phosphate isomerase/epimerase